MELRDQTIEKPSDMTNWDMSKRAYRNLVNITNGQLKDNKGNYPVIEIEVKPDSIERWEIVKVLDDKETSTQAYAFKKDNEIIVSYRGSKEFHDWIHTDANYLVLNANKSPSETRARHEAMKDVKGTLGIPNMDQEQIDKYNKQS